MELLSLKGPAGFLRDNQWLPLTTALRVPPKKEPVPVVMPHAKGFNGKGNIIFNRNNHVKPFLILTVNIHILFFLFR